MMIRSSWKAVRVAAMVTGLLAGLVAIPAAHGGVQLSDILADSLSVTSGDKVFDQFSFQATGDMPDAANIEIIPITDASGNFGIRVFGGFVDHTTSIGNSTLSLGYRVTPTGAALAIDGASLQGNPSILIDGMATVTQSFSGLPDTLIIFDGPNGTDLADATAFASLQSELTVDVLVDLAAGEAPVTASFVDMTFSQSAVIPEPASWLVWLMTMLLVGIIPTVYRRWAPTRLTVANRP